MFSAVLSSVDLGHAKPDEVCYLAALEAMGLCAEETAFVGHDGEELEGAARVGMRTIGFNCDANVVADVYLTQFHDLLGLAVRQSSYAAAG